MYQAGIDSPWNIDYPTKSLRNKVDVSTQMLHSSITWLLVGMLTRRLRKDTFIEETISVYSQRAH